METAITSSATGAPRPPPTQAGGSTGTRPVSWTLLDATPPMRTGGILTLTKSPSRRAGEAIIQEYLRHIFLHMDARQARPESGSWLGRARVEAKAESLACVYLFSLTLTKSSFTGTNALAAKLFETAARDVRRIHWVSPDIVAEHTRSQCIFGAIQALYLSQNRPRDRQIAERLTTLYRAAAEEDETVRPASITQFREFFLAHPEIGLPKITLTPDGTLRARWITGPGNFVAIEFTGEPNLKLVAEIPRENGLTASHFGSEPLENIVEVAQGMGASFASV
jgi:hypothetical protein